MKEVKGRALSVTYAGCFLGAGFVSGQELWQFFGSFGNWGYAGFLVAAVLFVVLGILLLRITQMTGMEEIDQVLIPWNIPWLHKTAGVISEIFLLGVIMIMTAGVAAMLTQLTGIPLWLGGALFIIAIAVMALLGVSGMVRVFSVLVPLLVAASIGFAVVAVHKFGISGAFTLTNSNANPLMPNWFVAAVTYVAYNILGAVGIITPLGKMVRERSSIYGGIALAGGMLTGVAVSIIVAIGVYPTAAMEELPMVALGSRLSPVLGTVYGILLLLGMFSNALASLVGLTFFVEKKHPTLEQRHKLVLAVIAALVWAGSLGGFGNLIGVIFPVFGYIGCVFMVFMVIHYRKCRRREKMETAA